MGTGPFLRKSLDCAGSQSLSEWLGADAEDKDLEKFASLSGAMALEIIN